MKGLMQYALIASLFLCNYVWPMHSELPALDVATATSLEPTILESPSLDISAENQHSDMDIFIDECTAHLQQNDVKFVQDKRDILEHELAQSDNEHRSAIIKEQIEIIDGLIEPQHVGTQKDTPYISNKDEKIGESSLLTDSFSPSSFPLVKKMILQDKLIGTCLEHLKQGDTKVVEDKRVILMHELSQCTHALRGEKLREQIQVLDTMIQQPDIQKFSQIFHIGEQSSSTSGQPNHVYQTLDRIRQATQHSRQNISQQTKPANALPLSKTWGGKLYIKIDGVKIYVSEGKHVSFSGSDWVVIGNGVYPVGVGQARIDKNGNCHVKDPSGRLHCLANCKWIAWTNRAVCLYQNKKLQIIPNTASILIDGQQLVNINGSLCVPQAPVPISSTTESCNLVSTSAYVAPNINTDVDARIEAALHELKVQYPDFQQHMQTVHSVLQDMKNQGLLTPTSEVVLTPEVLEAIAHCPKHFIKQFKFSDPRENPKEFVEAVIKYGVYATFHVMTKCAFLGLEKLAVIGTQVHALLQTDFSNMNAKQKAEFITEQVAEIIKAVLADLIGRKIIPKSKLGALPHSSSTLSTTREAVTPEGVKVGVSHEKQGGLGLKNNLNNSSNSNNIIQTLKPLNRGSTGRSIPENLTEKLVMEEIISNPNLGTEIPIKKGMTDIRWPASEGWIKMSWYHENVEIHYVAQFKNGIIQAIDDFKFVEKISL